MNFVLPLLSIALLVVLIAVPASLTYVRLEHWANGSAAAHFRAGQFEVRVPREHFAQWSLNMAADRKEHFLMALNMPGFVGEMLVDRVTSAWPSTWYPAATTREAWAAITWPIYCLPFWCLAGSAIDALSAARRVRTAWLMFDTVLCLACAVLGIGVGLVMTSDEKGVGIYALWGFALWAVLFATAPVALVRRWRASRIVRQEGPDALSGHQ